MSATREVVSLNGTWDIGPGTSSDPPSRWLSRIEVPSLVDTAIPAYPWRDAAYHWHRTRFTLAPAGRPERVFLVLEQAMFGTAVWLNGAAVGRDIACYTSQEYDISSSVRFGSENELLVRVGLRDTLPQESAVGNDQERDLFVPGIWGDTWIVRTGTPRIRRVQVIPKVAEGAAEVRVFVRNEGDEPCDVRIRCRAVTHDANDAASEEASEETSLPGGVEAVVTMRVEIPIARLWSPDDPFLYLMDTGVESGGRLQDDCSTSFGMREFRVAEGDFLLNGRKILLRGGNIAFHRFLSDASRARLPWDMQWARRLLIDIPKTHNFNVFRVHLGQMYNRWYDIADRHGMLIQNEWPFWTRSGSEEQIRREFTRWLEDNWNHPAIVLWDPMNESHDDFVAGDLVSEMKELDPTRAWEMRDFVDEHPYIYSLGPVLTDRKFGFSRSLREIEDSSTPSVVNEFLWWWLDPDNNPTRLTLDVLERWMGSVPSRADIVAHQSFLAAELIELFRRMKVDAIQPFVYLSNGMGPTGHWFLGDPANLEAKPVLSAIGNAFSRFGVSVELWDRHFTPGERRKVNIHVFNDRGQPQAGTLRWGVVDGEGKWVSGGEKAVPVGPGGGAGEGGGEGVVSGVGEAGDEGVRAEMVDRGGEQPRRGAPGPPAEQHVEAGAVESSILPVIVEFPSKPGTYEVRALLTPDNGDERSGETLVSTSSPRVMPGGGGDSGAVSRKPAFVIETPPLPESLKSMHPGVLEESGEIIRYLHSMGIAARDLGSSKCDECDVVLVADGLARGSSFSRHASELGEYLTSGGSLVLIEPEYGVETEATIPVADGVAFAIRRRTDVDRGGYDSFVFMDDADHPLWRGIHPDHLKFFNGGFGGEIVSQHDVTCTAPVHVLARCGLKLATVAAAEVRQGGGTVVLSRLQIRGRLTGARDSGALYGRRADPVAQRYLLNLLETYGRRRSTT